MRDMWRMYTVLATAAVAGYFALPTGTLADGVYVAVGLSCVAAIVVGTRRHRPASTAAWLFLAAGQAMWVSGDAIYSWLDASGTVTMPSLADVPYLMSYPLLAVGLLLMIRSQHRPRDIAGLADSAIVTAGFGFLSWAFIAGPIIDDTTTSSLGVVVALAYPAADIILLALLLRLMTGQGTWSPAFVLLVAAMATLLAADTVFAAAPSGDAYFVGLDVLWLASYVLWGAAALHPGMARLTHPVQFGRTPFTTGRLAVLGGFVLLPAALLIGRAVAGIDVNLTTLVVGSVVLSLLVMARMACDIDEIQATARQRDSLRNDLFRRATLDHVTGLANRPYIVQLISSALERGVRNGTPSALVDIQLVGVAEILREKGFQRRDETLRAVARRIEDVLVIDEGVARVGPDEFVVLIDRLDPHTDLSRLAHELLHAISAPLQVGGRPVPVSAGIGIAVSLDGSTDADLLLHEAHLAAGSALSGGSGPVEFFDASLRREQAERVEIETRLAEAISAGELEVHYQPVVAIGTGALEGFEALARWNRPGHGIQGPCGFIPIAEKSDLICELDRWVLHEATRQMVAWTAEDPVRSGDLGIAVNISGRHLASSRIVADVAAALQSSGLAPERLTIEVTETVLVDVPRASLQMTALRELGVRVSIDDFGTGYTSIGQLGSLSADVLKVDRSLVVSTEPGATELLALIVAAGHACGLLVVAEGVEHPHQLDGLRDLLYDSAQGFLFAEPRPAHLAHPRQTSHTA